MRIRSLILVSTIILAVVPEVSAYSPKEGNISATLGLLVHKTNFEPSHSGAVSPYHGDLAFIVNGDLNDRGQLELSVFHLNKRYFRDIAYRYVAEETELVEITMGYRHWISPWFSFAIAFSSAYSMGAVRLLHNDFAPDSPIDTSARDTTEYGFHLSAQADLYTYDRFSVVLNAIYSLSVTGKPGEKADHYGAMIGLRYFVQEKQVVDRPKDAIIPTKPPKK